MSNSPCCLLYSPCDVSLEDLVLDPLLFPLLIFFRYSHHLSAWYCIDIVGRNFVVVTHASEGLTAGIQGKPVFIATLIVIFQALTAANQYTRIVF